MISLVSTYKQSIQSLIKWKVNQFWVHQFSVYKTRTWQHFPCPIFYVIKLVYTTIFLAHTFLWRPMCMTIHGACTKIRVRQIAIFCSLSTFIFKKTLLAFKRPKQRHIFNISNWSKAAHSIEGQPESFMGT